MAELVIAGFHRSGTSLLSELLQRAGLFLGDELLGAMPTNPYGHFEDVEVVKLHERMLGDNDLTWHVDRPFVPWISARRWATMAAFAAKRRTAHPLWGFKDPRVCLFLHAWKYLMPDMRVVVAYRNFAESTYSLERRHSRELLTDHGPVHLHRQFWRKPDHALRMWITYNRAVLQFAEAYPDDTLVVSFDALAGGAPICAMINERWDVGLAEVSTFEVFDPQVTVSRPGRQPVASEKVAAVAADTLDRLAALADRSRATYSGAMQHV